MDQNSVSIKNKIYCDENKVSYKPEKTNLIAELSDLVIHDEPQEVKLVNIITDVSFSKPKPKHFFRTRPSEISGKTNLFAFIEDSDSDHTIYLVSPDIFEEFKSECYLAKLVTCISRQGSITLWPLRINKNGRANPWNSSAREAAILAEQNWIVKKAYNPDANCYEFREAQGNLGKPEWPEIEMDALLKMALKSYFVGDRNHPVIKRLQGFI